MLRGASERCYEDVVLWGYYERVSAMASVGRLSVGAVCQRKSQSWDSLSAYVSVVSCHDGFTNTIIRERSVRHPVDGRTDVNCE